MVFLTGRKLFAYSFLSGLAPWRFLPTGNCSPIVSCPTWLHSVSYRQETVREGFPIQLGSMVLLAHRKLFAKGFPFGLTPWCSLPTGNCSRKVSCPAWLHGFPYRQETVREGFPIRLGSMLLLAHRKLLAKGFLSDLTPWCFLPTGNCSPGDFSTPLEMTKGLGSMVLLTHRKLFAKGFLSALIPQCFLPKGNCSPGDFSTPLCSARNDKRAWLHGVSYPQETVCEGFPIRLGSMLFLAYRKLFTYSFLSGLAPWCFLPTGNCWRKVSCPT